MHIYSKLFKGTSFLSISEMVNQGCSLVRNIILARFLTKADFGVAALLGMVLTLLELSGKMALSQQVVQSKHGDEQEFLGAVQFTQFLAGALSALLILLAAWPLAHFFSGRQYLASIMALALIPFVNGLNNLDIYRYTRRLHFGPQVLAESIPQVLTTLAAWPLAAWFKDYRAILVILLAKAFLSAVMTHLLAERRFSMRFNTRWVRESLKFGAPLILSGFIWFGNFQGDSMVVAAAYPLAKLGVYSVALTMAMAPSLAVLRVSTSLAMPLLSEVQSDAARFARRYALFAQTMAVIGCCMTLGMLFCGEQVVVSLFGAKYAGVGALACWLTGAQSLRVLRGAPVCAAMARGDTVNNMVSTIWRLSGLAFAVGFGLFKASLEWFAVAAIVGEGISFMATTLRLSRTHYLPGMITLGPGILAAACVLFSVEIKALLAIPPNSLLNWLLLLAALVTAITAFLICFQELWRGAGGLVQHLRVRMSLSLENISRLAPVRTPNPRNEPRE